MWRSRASRCGCWLQAVAKRVRSQFDRPWGDKPPDLAARRHSRTSPYRSRRHRGNAGGLIGHAWRVPRQLALDGRQPPTISSKTPCRSGRLVVFRQRSRRVSRQAGIAPAGTLPTLRLANLVALRHPMSVGHLHRCDASDAKGILIRLIGGESTGPTAWAKCGTRAAARHCAGRAAGHGREEPISMHSRRCRSRPCRRPPLFRAVRCRWRAGGAGGPSPRKLALAAGLYAGTGSGRKDCFPIVAGTIPPRGVVAEPTRPGRPLIVVTFYRSYLTAADTGPVRMR